MKKNDFIVLGVSEELAEKCAAESAEELKGFIPKSRFDEVNGEKKKLEDAVKERDGQLEELKKSTGDVNDLKQKIEALQNDNKAKDEAHIAEIKKIKLDNAIDSALTSANVKNKTAVRALLKDLDKAELAEDGTVKGLSEQIEALRKSDDYLFTKKGEDIKGATIHESEDEDETPDYSKMTYDDIVASMSK